MSGCSLHEAFPDTAQKSGRVARAEERRRAAQCGGPALSFLKTADEETIGAVRLGYSGLAATESERSQWSLAIGAGEDPDRQRIKKTPPVAPMKAGAGREGFEGTQQPSNKEWLPIKITDVEVEQRNLVKDLVGQKVDDVIGQKSRNTLPRSVEGPNKLPDSTKDIYGFPVPNYFGKGEEDPTSSVLGVKGGFAEHEGFADFSKHLNDNPGYQLQQADFLGSFGASGLGKASGSPLLAKPSVNDAWKPLTPSGARSSFFEALPAPGGEPVSNGSSSFSREEKETLLKKLDTLFARLEDMEARRNEYAHAEMSLFILSGLILIFGLETVRKMK